MCSQSDTCCPIFTCWYLSVRKADIQSTINSGRWYIVLSLVISMVWSMWSNALLKSKSRILTYCFSLQSSAALLQLWYSSTSAWTVELPLLQPYWVGSTFTMTLSQIHFTTKDSWILLTTGVRDIRRRSFSSLSEGFTLGSYTTSADFMSDGAYVSRNDALIR